MAQQSVPKPGTNAATGTLNLIVANKHGCVIASDSRMSSTDGVFLCNGHMQSYCDNSQKLFRTTPNSALVIAGFAVDRRQTPLDLALAPVLLKEFGPAGWPSDEHAPDVPDVLKNMLSEALTGVASLDFPFDSQHFARQTLTVTCARLDKNSTPVLRKLLFSEKLTSSPPLQVNVPQFEVADSGEVAVTEFQMYPVGLPYVALAIRDAQWDSDDPDILKYYDSKKREQLNSMTLIEMRKLAAAILRESRKVLLRVGGEDQLGVFPSDGSSIEFHLPPNLPTDAESIPSVLSYRGLDCSEKTTPCHGPMLLSLDGSRLRGPYKKFFFASKFTNIPVALVDNIFVGNSFDGVTFIWGGGTANPFMLHNKVTHCTLEIDKDAPIPPDIPVDLRECQLVRKAVPDYPPGTVGVRSIFNVGGGIAIQSFQP